MIVLVRGCPNEMKEITPVNNPEILHYTLAYALQSYEKLPEFSSDSFYRILRREVPYWASPIITGEIPSAVFASAAVWAAASGLDRA